ncbi:hypothetical protein M3J09_004118 [Ascochyta lentis]
MATEAFSRLLCTFHCISHSLSPMSSPTRRRLLIRCTTFKQAIDASAMYLSQYSTWFPTCLSTAGPVTASIRYCRLHACSSLSRWALWKLAHRS